MPNSVSLFVDPAGTFRAPYSVERTTRDNNGKNQYANLQVDILHETSNFGLTVTVYQRTSPNASWVEGMSTYTTNSVESILLTGEIKVEVSSGSGMATEVTESELESGEQYIIYQTGTVNWLDIGATSTDVGTLFTYNNTNSITGTGKATPLSIAKVYLEEVL